ncbi:MAG TPA: redoxin domain-containing protein [Candidatus Acidoferrales bacterium]|nr:redoxin domain-containing protein [Candidatus Acidoferrales bacterium]
MATLFICGMIVCAVAVRGQGTGQTVDGRIAALNQKAPDFPPPGFKATGITWIDSQPLTLADLHGKVVMIDFWEYTCINCVRTFPQNKEWYTRYHKYGFEIIGVHDPEFQIAYDVANVEAAVKRYALPYPIVVDDYFKIWGAYRNNVWPNRFLIDGNGNVRYELEGEGDDHNFEVLIRQLLDEAHPGLAFPQDYTLPVAENMNAPACGGTPTDEMYVGKWGDRGILENPDPYHPGVTVNYKLPDKVDDGHAVISGKWETDPNGMIFEGKAQQPEQNSSRMEMKYHATQVYAVMNVAQGKPERLYILQDGKDLTNDDKGADVKIDANGHSYIDVDSSRMYYLAANKEFGNHTLELIPTAPGIEVDSFTFGNSCETTFPHV